MPSMSARVFRLENTVMHYAWGATDAIPALLSIENPDARPFAELWMGAHPSAPSSIVDDGRRIALDRAIEQDSARFLGESVARRFGARLPFLFKVLSAREPLSIQCHPSDAQAREGFAREEANGPARDAPTRNYKDASAKPELLVALTPFVALKGFRAPHEIARLLRRSAPGALDALAAQVTSGSVADGLRAVLSFALTTTGDERDRVLRALDDGVAQRPTPEAALVAQLRALHPNDLTVLAPLFLRLVFLQPGEGVFLGPGELHAYVSGTGLELMSSSDNVLRGGLTKKHVDPDELARVARFVVDDGAVYVGAREGTLNRYDTPAREVRLFDLAFDGEAAFPCDTPSIVLALEGALALVDGEPLALTKGEAAFVCAGAKPTLTGQARVAIATLRDEEVPLSAVDDDAPRGA